MILDVGCGSGEYEAFSSRRGQVNFDVQKPKDKPNNFVLGDAHSLPFRSGIFEKALLIDVIEHLNSPIVALKELKRVVEKGGTIFLGTPNALYLPKILMTLFKGQYVPDKDHVITFGIPELRNLLKRSGFNSFQIKAMTYRDDKYNHLISTILHFFRPELRGRQIMAKITT
jgi:ubiquinone/menaquinone biosynthesis C-methylase UbiE